MTDFGEKPRTRGRYSFDPIDALWPPQGTTALARVLHVSRVTIYRYREIGLDSTQADAVACALGKHPSELWPTWLEDADLERCVWCATPVPPTRLTCGPNHAHQVRMERDFINSLGEIHQRRRAWWGRLNRYRAAI